MEESWCACLNCKKPVVGRCTVCEQPLCEADWYAWAAGHTPCAIAHGPHVALVVRSPWAQMIVSGEKTWELRSTGTSRRGRIAIALAGSGHLLGEVTLTGAKCVQQESGDDSALKRNKDKHCVETWPFIRSKKVWAWELANAKKYDQPVPYSHTKGCIVWVRLTKDASSKAKGKETPPE